MNYLPGDKEKLNWLTPVKKQPFLGMATQTRNTHCKSQWTDQDFPFLSFPGLFHVPQGPIVKPQRPVPTDPTGSAGRKNKSRLLAASLFTSLGTSILWKNVNKNGSIRTFWIWLLPRPWRRHSGPIWKVEEVFLGPIFGASKTRGEGDTKNQEVQYFSQKPSLKKGMPYILGILVKPWALNRPSGQNEVDTFAHPDCGSGEEPAIHDA